MFTFSGGLAARMQADTSSAQAFVAHSEIFAGLRAAGLPIFHVVLDAAEELLRARIEASDEARHWRLAHLAPYRDARRWLCQEADLVVDTAVLDAAQAAHQIASALPRLSATRS